MRLLKIFLLALALFIVERLCHRATDGFALVNVYAPVGDYSKWQRDNPIDPKFTQQTYHFFDSGSQSYVFVSEDGKFVLKLFKFQHMRTPPLFDFLPSTGYLGKKREKKWAVLEKTFDSITLAYDHFRIETGLLYVHLAKTDHLHISLTIIDKIGKKHLLDLDKTPFLLQKRGTLAYRAIDNWMEKGEIDKAKQGISALLKLAVSRCHKGMFDKDPDFSTNFGFIDETPFQIDFGRLSVNAAEADPTVFAPEMVRITRHFESWIAKKHPDLLDSFQEELSEIILP